jgi:PAS domain S-box-containing protein
VLKKAFNQTTVHNYINKPFDPDSLGTIVQLAIEGYRLAKERENIQKQLTVSENKFRGIFNSMADVFSRINFDGTIEVLSPSAKELFGYSLDELIGKDVSLLYADPKQRTQLISKLKKLPIIRGAEIAILTKNGERKTISETAKLYYNNKNEPIGVECISRDISENKRMEQLLQEQYRLINETQRMARVGSWHFDSKTNKITWSDTLVAIYGIKNRKDIDNSLDNYLSFFHHSDRVRARTIITNTLASKEDFFFEASIVRADKESRTLSFSGKVQLNSKEEIEKITVACIDITETKLRENELIKSEEKFRFLAEEFPIHVLKVDKKLDVIYANKLAKDEVIPSKGNGSTIHSYFNEDVLPRIIDAIEKVLEEEKGYSLEFQTQKKWYSLTISPSRNTSEVESTLLVMQDITEKKESEKILTTLNEKLEFKVAQRTRDLEEAKKDVEIAYQKEKELGQLKSQFVSTASHQFRTPLTVIHSNIGLLEMQVQQSDPEFQKKFNRVYERIQAEVKRMTELMDNVLILGKKESGAVVAKLQMLDVLSLVQLIVGRHNDIQEDGRKAEVTHSGSPSMYNLDPELFENAFSNLISNAFKYSTENPAPTVNLQFTKGTLEITVRDFGIGVPSDEVGHIFEPFYRANNVTDINGTGLGTSIVKAYIELMEGSVEVESEVGEGTTFTIYFEK